MQNDFRFTELWNMLWHKFGSARLSGYVAGATG